MRKQNWLVLLLLAGAQAAWCGDWEQKLAVANQHLRAGRLTEAETLYRIAERTASDEQRGIVLSNLGAVAYGRAQFPEAERLWRRALELGVPAVDMAVTWSNLGTALSAQGRIHAAEEAYEQALTLAPAGSAIAGNILNNRAELYRRAGRLAEAEQDARAALAVAQKNSTDQLAIASRLHTLATILGERGQLQDALELLRRARELKVAAGLADHPDMAPTASAMSQILLLMGRYADAEELASEALAIARRTQGARHPRVAVALDLLASVYDATGRRAEADPLFREALAISEAALGRNHFETARVRVDFAAHMRALGRNQAAITLYSDALKAFESTLGPESRQVSAVHTAMAETYRAMGRPTEAARAERTTTAASFR